MGAASVMVMEEGFEQLGDEELLAVLDRVLDALLDSRVRLDGAPDRMALLLRGLRVGARLQTWQALLAAALEADGAAWVEHGTSTSTWLADAVNLTRREAARLVAAGQGLARFGEVAAAAGAGTVLPGQAEAITGVLDQLPDDFPDVAIGRAQELMVGFAGTHNSTELRRLTARLVEVLDPDTAEQREAERVEREYRLARRNRHLVFSYDHQGSVLFKGSLPVAEAEPFLRVIDAYAAAGKRGLDRLDPAAEHRTPAMGRADALLAMVDAHARQSLAPTHGGDRPRVVVTLSYDKLLKAAGDGVLDLGHLVGCGEPVPAGVLRRWLCDADLLPAVMGGPSEALDVGRTQRLVTEPIRAALELRDRGCVFPGCDKPPWACHAHHKVPWWAGGVTALSNLALVCDHHHGIVEPGHDPTADRWRLEFREDGIPFVIPPRRVDPRQRARVHARFLTPPAPAV